MANSSVMTLRLAPALLTELKARARAEGRSTSAEVIYLIERVLRIPRVKGPAKQSTMGMFAHLNAPDLAEFQNDSQVFARTFEQSIAESIERYHDPAELPKSKRVHETRKRSIRQANSK